jgi:hypothetical protein
MLTNSDTMARGVAVTHGSGRRTRHWHVSGQVRSNALGHVFTTQELSRSDRTHGGGASSHHAARQIAGSVAHGRARPDATS